MLERYNHEHQRSTAPSQWVVDTFLDISVPHETLLAVLESIYYGEEAPFRGRGRHVIGNDMLYLCSKWYHDSLRSGGRLFGGDDEAAVVSESLAALLKDGLGAPEKTDECRVLRERIERFLR